LVAANLRAALSATADNAGKQQKVPDYAVFCGGFFFGTADVATSRFSNQFSA